MKKITYNCQMRNEHFLIVIYHSSLVKGAMNAARKFSFCTYVNVETLVIFKTPLRIYFLPSHFKAFL
jgi:hypothetical protein